MVRVVRSRLAEGRLGQHQGGRREQSARRRRHQESFQVGLPVWVNLSNRLIMA
jgi:hypothetical protein